MPCSSVGFNRLLLAPSELPHHGKVALGAGSRPERLPRILELGVAFDGHIHQT